jgi:flavin reductase (DIM6/NTAB) family NADH-FMN oxidoreductase RutF
VTTLSPDGVVNLAPFSYFQLVSAWPPLVSICIGQRQVNGVFVDKDTLRNIKDTGEFVVNVATEANIDAINQSSAEYGPEVSELAVLGLTALPGEVVKPPRVGESPIQIECRRERVIMLGHAPETGAAGHGMTGMVIGEIVRVHVDDALWDAAAGMVDPGKLRPLARLGGALYAGLGEIHARQRPG